MMADIWTVMWKERKGLFRHRGNRLRAVITLLVPVAMVAIYFPLEIGHDWVDSPVALFSMIVPLIMVGMAIPDSFAGERERHTLGTLLASRLPDRAILFGKIAVGVGYGWIATIIILLLGLVTVNAAHWEGHVLLYSPTIALVVIVLSFLVAMLVAGVGIFISLRAATVQEAQQLLMTLFMVFPIVLGFVFFAFHNQIGDALEGIDVIQIVYAAMGVLFIVDVVLLLAAAARFQRARLILN
jgi:ABC-2 type transport system permease protein